MRHAFENNTIEKLERNFWEEPTIYPSKLVQRIFQLRKKCIKDLDGEELRLLITQDVGVNIIIDRVLNLLSENIFIESSFYPGDLLLAVLKIPDYFWNDHWEQLKKLLRIINQNVYNKKILDDNTDDLEEEVKAEIMLFLNKFKHINF